jgi:hypothetical protein
MNMLTETFAKLKGVWEPSAAKQRLRKHVYVEMRFMDKQSVARRNLQQYMTTVGNRQVFH